MPRVAALSFVAATLVATVGAAASPVAAGDASKLQRQLDGLVETEGGPPGAIAVVQRGDDQEVYTAGVADLSSDTALDEHQHVRVASVAKAFSGAVALSLVDQGVLSLDDTVADRLPQYTKWGEVTLRQLLGHTSGVPELLSAPETQEAIEASPGVPPPPDQLLAYVQDEPLQFEPGSTYHYVNSDNILIGLMVEAATGRPYADVLKTEVTDELDMPETSLPVGPEIASPFVNGYDVSDPIDPQDVSEVLAAGWAWAAGGVVSTPAELTKFVRGYVSGELFGPDVVKEQRTFEPAGTSEPPGPGKNAPGLAIFRYKTRCGTVFGHTGNTLGYTQFVAASRDGERSATVSITAQITPKGSDVFPQLRKAEETAVCLALEGD